MILNDIKAALEEVDERVFYGRAGELDDRDLWDYTVFSRSTLRASGGRTGFTDEFQVAVVREGYIPDGDLDATIRAVLSIPGMRLSGDEFRYLYDTKPGTAAVVELIVLTFSRPRKSDD